MNLHHVSLPIVLSREGFATISRIVASRHAAVELLLLFVPVVDVSLEMCLGSEALAAVRVRAFMIFAMVSLVVPGIC